MTPTKPVRRRFTIRRLMLLTLMIALGLGWFRTDMQRKRVWRIAGTRETQLRTLEESVKPLLERTKQNDRNRGRGFVSGMNMDGCDLRGIRLTTGVGAFQSTSLMGARMQNATITCGGSSFQNVNFNHANLTGAKLTATGSSFQIVTFVGANLTNATLVGGNGAVFQENSFRNADLTGATIQCSGISAFQVVDLDSAILVAADLSSIYPDNLTHAYFATPPIYDSRTKLPAGFDPQAAGWKLIEVPQK